MAMVRLMKSQCPLSTVTAAKTSKILFGAFGVGDNDDHLVVNNDGTVDFTADNEDYQEVFNSCTLQEKGLIEPSF